MPTVWLWPSVDSGAPVINTFTSTITFVLVALLQNTEARAENATLRKLNAIAAAPADQMDELGAEHRTCAVRATSSPQRSESNRESTNDCGKALSDRGLSYCAQRFSWRSHTGSAPPAVAATRVEALRRLQTR
jgi:hypothetical protein